MFKRITAVNFVVLSALLIWSPSLIAANANDYIIAGRADIFAQPFTLPNLRAAYQHFDAGINDQSCTDCAASKELVFWHASARAAMLFIDNNDVTKNSFLEIAKQYGITVREDFGSADANLFTPAITDGCYAIPDGAFATTWDKIPDLVYEANDIISELDLIDNTDFKVTLHPAETGLQNDLEVGYGEVLLTKSFLYWLKTDLEMQQAYDIYLNISSGTIKDILDARFCALHYLGNFSVGDDLFGANPNFLKILPTSNSLANGKIFLAKSKTDFIKSMDCYLDAAAFIKDQTGPVENHLIYVDPNYSRALDAANANVTALRDSAKDDKALSIRLGATKHYNIKKNGSSIGGLAVAFDMTNVRGSSGSMYLSSAPALPWHVTNCSIDGDTLTVDLESGLDDGSEAYFEATISQDGNSLSNGLLEYWGPGEGPCTDSFYEVWAGNTDYCSYPDGQDYLYSIDQQPDYVYLGESDGSQTQSFSDDNYYDYFVIAARHEFLLDSIQGSTDDYFDGFGTLCTGNDSAWWNIAGAPDGLYDSVGVRATLGTFRGYVQVTNPGWWDGITVYSDRNCYDQISLSGLTGTCTSSEVVSTRVNLNPIFGSTHYPNPVSLRDAMPLFGASESVPGTFGHNLNNDATLGGILPDMTQQLWIDVLKLTSITGYIKSGSTPVAGVTVTASGGIATTTNSAGYYILAVPNEWTGTVTPTRTGYSFSPSVKTYSTAVTEPTSAQNFTAYIRPTISGYIKTSSGTAVSGVTITGSNGGGTTTTNTTGYYALRVPYNWSGSVRPTKTNYTLSPTSRAYTYVKSSKASQNFTIYVNPTISGYVKTSAGAAISGVVMSASNVSATVTTSSSGYYALRVPYNWSGTVKCSKSYYTWSPSSRAYSAVTSSKSSQNFTGYSWPTISGCVKTSGGTAISAVTMITSTGSRTTTSASGYYAIRVPYNWTGNIRPSKTGLTFLPVSRAYTALTASKSSQNYTGK